MKATRRVNGLSGGVLGVVFAYALFAGLWILLSDRAMGLLISDPEALVRASMAKGWFFVAVTSLLLYFLVRRLVGQIRLAYQREIAAHEEGQRSLDLLAAIVENTDDAIFAKDLEGRYLLFNNAASRMVGKPVAEVLGRDDRGIFPAEQADALMETGRRVLASGNIETNEEILDTTQGRRVFLATKGPLRDTRKQVLGIFGISRDITERMGMEAKLRESEARLRLLIEHVPVALAMFDRDMRYLAVNRHWLEDFDVGEREVIGHSHYEIFPDLPEAWLAAHRLGLAGEVVASDGEPFQPRDGQVVWTRWAVRPWHTASGSIGGIVIFAENITARKQAELEASKSERRFHDIVEASADWIWEVDAAGRFTYVSDSVQALLGYTPAEILGKTPFDLMPADEAGRLRTEFLTAAARKAMFRDLDNINLHKDGSLRHVQTNGMPILAADGTLLGYRGLDRDVTEKKQAERELRDAKEQMRALVNTIPDLIWLKDADGRYLACNPRFEQFFGATEAEIIGKTDYDFVPRELADSFRANDLAASKAAGPLVNEEEVAFASDGHREILQTIKTPFHARDGQIIGVLGIARDISDRKTAEEELRQRNAELERFNRATVGRELDMIAMKVQINALSRELGRAPPYPLEFLKGKDAPP